MVRYINATAFEMVLVAISTSYMTPLLQSEKRRTSLALLLQRNTICNFHNKAACGPFAILKKNQGASLYLLHSITR